MTTFYWICAVIMTIVFLRWGPQQCSDERSGAREILYKN
jgi:hypothetical protein